MNREGGSEDYLRLIIEAYFEDPDRVMAIHVPDREKMKRVLQVIDQDWMTKNMKWPCLGLLGEEERCYVIYDGLEHDLINQRLKDHGLFVLESPEAQQMLGSKLRRN